MFLLQQLDNTAKKIKSQIANALTLVNLCLGAFAIIYVIQNQLHIALLFITIAALCDRLDGAAARRFNAVSDFGKQLDSLSDLVSFGVAPAFLIFQASLNSFGLPGMFLTIFFILCGAIRLARFNVTTPKFHFVGLPITAAGCILTLQILIVPYLPSYFFMFLTLILSILMISTFKVRKI
ncbi:CDP-diacylglycerol--serine O-phosphatidyltransferase [Halalkalibacter hemicellulosilyticus]|uniref:CDP-diacylglycerol--serine O-phosphatidyltransferase n=1 Tax=Halalkalibacter hemicellulosilyticusJCM 9152 TaxID=1236971 RepID=W4QJX3_9BACI|nr:CDP-diacylglycerol--serine O-phosphatidyltransferase [Halalkalibacter hemicellulosilyticus]GAE31654.1 CDP-diacylglycerol-serine O-phosphatidyltransferase [Halalkalibacter hemicellulosilyticusJCM 9152]